MVSNIYYMIEKDFMKSKKFKRKATKKISLEVLSKVTGKSKKWLIQELENMTFFQLPLTNGKDMIHISSIPLQITLIKAIKKGNTINRNFNQKRIPLK